MTRIPYRPALLAASLAVAVVAGLTACGADSTDDAAGGGPKRTVDTAMGEVRVPETPARVVVLDTAELDSAITLGVRPVGATRADVASGFLNYLPKDKVKGITDVGAIGSPSLEKIASLKPDLILTNKERDASRFGELSAIAPTVMTESTGYPWKRNFLTHATALGRTAEARKVVADYTAHARRVTAAVGGPARAAKTEVNVVRFVEGADIRIYGKKNYIATVLADAGLGRPPVTDKARDGFSYDVSPERIDQADADAIFTSTYGDPKKSKATRTTSSGLWKNMNAVRAGASFTVDDQLWIQGIGYTAAHQILDELQRDLTRGAPRAD
ncbi:ABC transporter substrate-binding protein [Streptomyces sp. NPDC057702]|uniref:ABC transporter substrate-binding protein n=1 Tax=unclassified Streptomyces TaxID=2593676 RepID=UPI00368F0BAE